jgi:hypothetical protein
MGLCLPSGRRSLINTSLEPIGLEKKTAVSIWESKTSLIPGSPKSVDCGIMLCQHKMFIQKSYDVPGLCDYITIYLSLFCYGFIRHLPDFACQLHFFSSAQASHVTLPGKEMQ